MSDVVIIGAGVFGAWTAHHLAEAGARVTLVDAYGPGNSRSSSGDESRILRCGYGRDEIYSRWARRSREQWRDLDVRNNNFSLPLWHQCGVLWLAPADDSYAVDTLATLRELHHPIELLDRLELRARYPHLDAAEVGMAMLEPESGVILARRSVQTLIAELSRKGVRLQHGRAVRPAASGRIPAVHVSDGPALPGDAFVFACGAWLPAVFPELLGPRITPTRQVVMYFGTRAGDDCLTAAHTPAWVDFASGIYGVPDIEGRGIKVGIDTHGARFDPDSGDRQIDEDSLQIARVWLRRRFASMIDAPLVEARVCQYENTSNGDFLIDRHPHHDNVWLVGGGSGHGFKHGPAIGEYVTRLITTGGAPDVRFALQSKGTVPQRAVY